MCNRLLIASHHHNSESFVKVALATPANVRAKLPLISSLKVGEVPIAPLRHRRGPTMLCELAAWPRRAVKFRVFRGFIVQWPKLLLQPKAYLLYSAFHFF
jgi:hypothetical protein